MYNYSGRCTTWEDDGVWLGYCKAYAGYFTQGKTPGDLMANLIDVYEGLAGGHVPSLPYNREPMDILKDEYIILNLHLLGCVILRHGGKHDWYENPRTKVYQPVLRCEKLNESLAKYIIKQLS